MNDSFREITIQPPLPCVYHDCDGQATVAIAYEVSEHEWRMVPTCDRHTVPVPVRHEMPSNAAHPEEATAVGQSSRRSSGGH